MRKKLPLRDQLRRAVREALRAELRSTGLTRLKVIDPRKRAVAQELEKHPGIENEDLCREMDKLQESDAYCTAYRPLPNWEHRLWVEALKHEPTSVRPYIAKIRSNLSHYLVPD
jgi:hypothetical protein